MVYDFLSSDRTRTGFILLTEKFNAILGGKETRLLEGCHKIGSFRLLIVVR
jgi:hypothetical protein